MIRSKAYLMVLASNYLFPTTTLNRLVYSDTFCGAKWIDEGCKQLFTGICVHLHTKSILSQTLFYVVQYFVRLFSTLIVLSVWGQRII